MAGTRLVALLVVELLSEPEGNFIARSGRLQETRKTDAPESKVQLAHPKAKKAKAVPMAGLAVPLISDPSIALYVEGFAFCPVFMNDLA